MSKDAENVPMSKDDSLKAFLTKWLFITATELKESKEANDEELLKIQGIKPTVEMIPDVLKIWAEQSRIKATGQMCKQMAELLLAHKAHEKAEAESE